MLNANEQGLASDGPAHHPAWQTMEPLPGCHGAEWRLLRLPAGASAAEIGGKSGVEGCPACVGNCCRAGGGGGGGGYLVVET